MLILPHVLAGLTLLQTHPVRQIDSIVNAGIQDGVFPSAVVVIGSADTVFLKRGFGSMTWEPGPAPDPDSALYDLASLTKVIGTASGIITLVQRDMLDLDTPLQTFVPDFSGPGKQAVTVRHVLNHTSGLRAFLPLHTTAADAVEARRLVVTENLRWPVGSHVVYSDLNGMLAGWVVEAASGQPLSDYLREFVFEPNGMTRTQFGVPSDMKAWAVPINLWRGHPISGVIHDQNAEKLGGVSGHAGLYSTGADVARLSQWYLRGGRTGNGVQTAIPELITTFTRRAGNGRALGWELKDTTSADNSGTLLSRNAFGHTGFTGTSVWIDPSNDVFVVILTNRVMAPRHPRSIAALKRIRGELADAAVLLRWHACRIRRLQTEDATCVVGPLDSPD